MQHFDVRKMEFSLEEIAKRKKAEAKERVRGRKSVPARGAKSERGSCRSSCGEEASRITLKNPDQQTWFAHRSSWSCRPRRGSTNGSRFCWRWPRRQKRRTWR